MTEAEIQNFDAFDAFDDADEKQGDQSKVHIRVQQRNGRKCITTVQGLADDLIVDFTLIAILAREAHRKVLGVLCSEYKGTTKGMKPIRRAKRVRKLLNAAFH